MGAVTPLGNDVETFWENLVAGQGGAAPITLFDPSEFAVHFACELKDFEPAQWIEHRKARRMDRFTQMILAAARMAEEDSGFEIEPETGADRRLGRDGDRRDCRASRIATTSCSTAAPTGSTHSRSRRSSRTWAPPGSRWSWARAGR